MYDLSTHAGEKPFAACITCGNTFKNSWCLKKHTRTCIGEEPLQCKTCDKTFEHGWGLKKPKRTHTGEKPLAYINVEGHWNNTMVSRNTKVPTLVRSCLHTSHVRNIQTQLIFEEAWKDTHRRGTISMQNMWQDTAKVRSTKGPTLERSPLLAINVERHLHHSAFLTHEKLP